MSNTDTGVGGNSPGTQFGRGSVANMIQANTGPINFSTATGNTVDFKQSKAGVNVLGSISGAKSVDLSLGDLITATITGPTTITFTNVAAAGKGSCITMIVTNAGANLAFAVVPKWPAATPPTLSVAGVDILTFLTVDGGTTWYGVPSSIGAA